MIDRIDAEAGRLRDALVAKYGAVSPEDTGSYWIAPDGTIVGSGAHIEDARDAVLGAGLTPRARREIRGHLECSDNVWFDAMTERGFVRCGSGDYGLPLPLFFLEVPLRGATEAQRRTMGRLFALHGRGAETTYSVGKESFDRWTDLLRRLTSLSPLTMAA